MKKMDEMDRSIYLRSVEWAYRAVALGLCVWTFYNIWQTLVHDAAYAPLPGLILCLGGSVQGFSSPAMKLARLLKLHVDEIFFLDEE